MSQRGVRAASQSSFAWPAPVSGCGLPSAASSRFLCSHPVTCAACSSPARSAARFACSPASPRFQVSRNAASRAFGGIPASPPVRPSASMLTQLPGIALAIFFNGSAMQRAPLWVKTPGASPSSASPIIRLAARSGISSAKRFTFCQSIASSRSKLSSSASTASRARRSSAAASPPRICGPLVRTIKPYRPARAAASSSSVPAVITPLPPLPASATETDAPGVPIEVLAAITLGSFAEVPIPGSETAARRSEPDADQVIRKLPG